MIVGEGLWKQLESSNKLPYYGFDKDAIRRQLRDVVLRDFQMATECHLFSLEEHDNLLSMINSLDIESIQLAHEIIINRMK